LVLIRIAISFVWIWAKLHAIRRQHNADQTPN
jgi:hypothetical protein